MTTGLIKDFRCHEMRSDFSHKLLVTKFEKKAYPVVSLVIADGNHDLHTYVASLGIDNTFTLKQVTAHS